MGCDDWWHWNDLMGIFDPKEVSLPVDRVPELENSVFKIILQSLKEVFFPGH